MVLDPAGNRARVNFIKAELRVAQTCCEVAQKRDGDRRRTYLKNARMAYENVIRYMLRAELRDDEFAYITANTERVKFALEALEGQYHKDATRKGKRK